jgi:hypothetical protein
VVTWQFIRIYTLGWKLVVVGLSAKPI